MAFHNGGANMGFIGYADQLISGASNELGIRSQDDIIFATGGNTERFRISTSTITCATGVGMAIDGGTSQQVIDSTLLVTKHNNDWALQVRNYMFLLTTDFILAVKIIQIMLLSMMLITLLGDLELVVQEESMQPTQQYLQFRIKD